VRQLRCAYRDEPYARRHTVTNELRLDGRVAIVTGAAGGMGSAISSTLASAGALVVASDLRDGAGDALVHEIREAGGTADYVAADVADSVAVQALVTAAVDMHGRLDCAVNAAAIEFETVPITETDEADFERMMAVNVRSVYLSMKYEIRAMLAAGNGGSIVNIGSTNSFRPQANQPAYTASKHAVLGLTRSAALDYARHGIRVNAIAPGAIETPMLDDAIARWGLDRDRVAGHMSLFKRFGDPQEIADAALWLCSDASSYTTGHALPVDGGFLSH
jgi:NAD(P)-dependent dehydrogenase (short-subunit alcohol dehydrogenase family)